MVIREYDDDMAKPSDGWERPDKGRLTVKKRVGTREGTVDEFFVPGETFQYVWRVTYWRRPDARPLATGRAHKKHVAMRCANAILDVLDAYEKTA